MKKLHSNDHGMLMYAPNKPFGHLLHFKDHGVFDPTHGKVDVAPELVKAHNRTLDEGYIKGLDENCKVGQGGFFYHTRDKETRAHQVTTFTGKVVSTEVTVKGETLTFLRGGKTFRGRLRKGSDNFNFKRVS